MLLRTFIPKRWRKWHFISVRKRKDSSKQISAFSFCKMMLKTNNRSTCAREDLWTVVSWNRLLISHQLIRNMSRKPVRNINRKIIWMLLKTIYLLIRLSKHAKLLLKFITVLTIQKMLNSTKNCFKWLSSFNLLTYLKWLNSNTYSSLTFCFRIRD